MSGSAVNKNMVPRYASLVWVALTLNFLLVLFVLGMVHFSFRYKRQFQIDRRLFAENVQFAVTNFLASYQSLQIEQGDTEFTTPQVVQICDMAFYRSPRRGDFVILDGAEYGIGDYCQHGLICSISRDRVYCRNSEGIVILRPGGKTLPPTPAPAAGSAGAAAGEGDAFAGLRL